MTGKKSMNIEEVKKVYAGNLKFVLKYVKELLPAPPKPKTF